MQDFDNFKNLITEMLLEFIYFEKNNQDFLNKYKNK